jgi:hypothetical protein
MIILFGAMMPSLCYTLKAAWLWLFGRHLSPSACLQPARFPRLHLHMPSRCRTRKVHQIVSKSLSLASVNVSSFFWNNTSRDVRARDEQKGRISHTTLLAGYHVTAAHPPSNCAPSPLCRFCPRVDPVRLLVDRISERPAFPVCCGFRVPHLDNQRATCQPRYDDFKTRCLTTSWGILLSQMFRHTLF